MIRKARTWLRAKTVHPLWRRTAPFDSPVVPEVYMMTIGSK